MFIRLPNGSNKKYNSDPVISNNPTPNIIERYDVICSLEVRDALKLLVIEKKIITVHGRAMVSGFTGLKWCVANNPRYSGNNSLINSHKVIGVKLITKTNVVIADILLFKIDLMFSLLN